MKVTKLLIGMSLVLSVNSAFAGNVLPGPNQETARKGGSKVVTEQIGSITVVTPKATDIIVFQVDSIKINTRSNGFDLFSDGVHRLHFDRYNTRYEYRNSQGLYKGDVDMSSEDIGALYSSMGFISKTCPAKVEVERATFKILKITKSCDDLAAVNVEANAG